jgi:hypothetical protein
MSLSERAEESSFAMVRALTATGGRTCLTGRKIRAGRCYCLVGWDGSAREIMPEQELDDDVPGAGYVRSIPGHWAGYWAGSA